MSSIDVFIVVVSDIRSTNSRLGVELENRHRTVSGMWQISRGPIIPIKSWIMITPA